MRNNLYKRFMYLRWKKKDNIAIFLIIVVGLLMTSIGFLYNNFYSIFLSLCLGFFIGGFLLSIISTFLAQMESNITGAGEIDAEVDVDIDAEVDVDIDADIDAEIDADGDMYVDGSITIADSNLLVGHSSATWPSGANIELSSTSTTRQMV